MNFSFWPSRPKNQVRNKMCNPRRKLPPGEADRLKNRINNRLRNEDYTCRLPKVKKPKVRYKLSRRFISYGGFVGEAWG